METIALNESAEDKVKAVQKEHCKKSGKLEEALKKNWFITVDFDETMSAEHVSLAFSQDTGETSNVTIEAKNRAEYRRELARKEKRRRNAEKAHLRSMSLHY